MAASAYSSPVVSKSLVVPSKALYENAVSVDPTPCGNTEIDQYFATPIGWRRAEKKFSKNYSWLALDAVYYLDNTSGGQSYGSRGQFTSKVEHAFKRLQNFFGIPTDIILRDGHASVFQDVERLKRYFVIAQNYSEADARVLATNVSATYASLPKLKDHILLTANAFAATADEDVGAPKKIVMGDGIMEIYEKLGYGNIAPQAILAHEYAHQVQFAKNVVFKNTPEGTRKTELMADAFSGYFLTHRDGLSYNARKVGVFLKVFFDVGDCAFSSRGHHGTPLQRMAAATFGMKTAANAKNQAKILSPEQFIELFNAELPSIVA